MAGELIGGDVVRLARTFASARQAHYDTSDAIARQVLAGKAWVDRLKIGEGRHFATYEIAAHGEKAQTAMRLCLHVSSENFHRDRIESEIAAWRSAIERLQRLSLPLVPPIHFLSLPERVVYLMPLGDQPLTMAAPHWHPTDELVDRAVREFAMRGIALGDVPQTRCWQGIPFIYDFSDLHVSRDARF